MKIIWVILLCLPLVASSQKMYRAMEYSLVALNTADYFTTRYIVTHGGYERNPLMIKVVNDPVAFALVKGATTAAEIIGLRMILKENPKAAFVGLLALNIGMSYVVTNNFQVSLTLKL